MALGINLTILMGKSVPKPVPRELVEALKTVEVTHTDEGRSGFQIVFQLGRRDRDDIKDYQLVKNPLFQVFNRVALVVSFGHAAQVLMDGVITNQQLSPSPEPGQSTFTLTGEDVSALMDLEERSEEHAAQDEATIARMILKRYATYGVIPRVITPRFIDRPTQNERIPFQQGTDLAYLQQIGQRFAHVFYMVPGPVAGSSTAYWGPPQRQTRPQKALTMTMGSYTNLTSVNFQTDAMAATEVEGQVQDRHTNQVRPAQETRSDRPTLSANPALEDNRLRRTTQFRETGRDSAQADALVQAVVDRSVDDVVTVSGELDTIRYGDVLQLRGLVGLRGVGYSYDGLYYVKSVTHTLSSGQYKQKFTITRDGLGSTVERVAI
jgi:hypothetical protein